MSATIDEPAAFLVKGKKAYKIHTFNEEVGRIELRTEFGVEMVTTSEEAERCGYTAVRGFVRKWIGNARMSYAFVDEQGRRFDGKS